MVVEGDMFPLGVPFALGVAAAASFCPSGSAVSFLILVLTAASLLVCLRGRGGTALYALLFFCLGLFCACGRISFGTAGEWTPSFAESALRRLEALIGSVEYPHGRTGPLLKALLTGQRAALDADSLKAFRDAGASHILALSGLHLGLIYAIAGKVLKVLGNSRPAFLLRSVLLVAASSFYTLMTGAAPSLVRALIFIILNEFARLSPGRERRPVNLWCTALLLQLVIDPSVIVSVGFQLSYLAMLGILVLFPRLDGWYPRSSGWDPFRKAWSGMALSCSCQVFTGPLAWLRFGTFPKYFLLTNLMAMPLVSLLMTVSIACLVTTAAGICPEWLVITTDSLAEALQGCLETIAGM